MSTASIPSSRGVEKAILAAEEDLKAFLNSAEDLFYLMLGWIESHAETEHPETLIPERLKVSSRRVLTARTAVLTQADVPRDGRPWYKRGGGEGKLTDSEAAEALNLSVGVFRLQVKPELVSCLVDSLAVSFDGVEDLVGCLGPDVWAWVFVPGVDPLADVGVQGVNGAVRAAA